MAERILHPTHGIDLKYERIKGVYYLGRGNRVGQSQADHSDEDNWQSKHGVDIMCHRRTPVYAAFGGILVNAGVEEGHEKDGEDSRHHGNRVTVHAASDTAYYQHLDELAEDIVAGQQVREGQLIGYSGIGGGVPHLHFSLKSGRTQVALREARLPGTITETPYFTDSEFGPASRDYSADVSDPRYVVAPSPPQIRTPDDADSTDSETGNAVRKGPPAAPLLDYTPDTHPPDGYQTPSDANATDDMGAEVFRGVSGVSFGNAGDDFIPIPVLDASEAVSLAAMDVPLAIPDLSHMGGIGDGALSSLSDSAVQSTADPDWGAHSHGVQASDDWASYDAHIVDLGVANAAGSSYDADVGLGGHHSAFDGGNISFDVDHGAGSAFAIEAGLVDDGGMAGQNFMSPD